jgi:hypothetical protein
MADVVREISWLEGDTTFYNPKDVHYGHWAHQTIAWSVGFASLELLSNFCDDEYAYGTHTDGIIPTNNHTGRKINHIFLPPPLTRELGLNNATQEMNAAIESSKEVYDEFGCSLESNNNDTARDYKNPCIVSWISSPGLYRPHEINSFMEKHSSLATSTPIDGWHTENQMSEGWGNKIGWVPTKPGATFTLQFDQVEKDINIVTVFFLRSYGEKWKDSRAKFTIRRKTTDEEVELLEDEISGVHDREFSLTLSQELKLPHTIHKGETLSIQVDLVSGSAFKIMGLSICRN